MEEIFRESGFDTGCLDEAVDRTNQECSFSSSPGHIGRNILTGDQAQVIFSFRPQPFSKHRDRASTLAKMYGISAKSVRDIWCGRTWYRETYHMDPSKAPEMDRLLKKAGRPKGVKDSKPRAKKMSIHQGSVLKSETKSDQDNVGLADLVCDTLCKAERSDICNYPLPDDWVYWLSAHSTESDDLGHSLFPMDSDINVQC